MLDKWLNTIQLMDCLEGMRQLPDKCIDLVLTDPPYEKEAHTLQRRVKRNGGVMEIEEIEFPAITEQLRQDCAREMGRLAKKWVIVFCQIEAVPLWRIELEKHGLVYKRTCIWVKPDGMPQYSGDRPGMGYETFVVMHTAGRSKWNGGGRNGVFTFNKNDGGGIKSPHPTKKPILLMRELVALFSDEEETVLDAFMGSGTTARACKDLGRNFIGFEISEKYIEIANKRLQQEILF